MPHLLRLLRSIAIAIAPFALLACICFIIMPAPDMAQRQILQEKIQALIGNSTTSPRIIIGGDSRAKHYLIPEFFMRKTGFQTVNLAVAGGDLDMFDDVLEQKGLVGKKKILIFSVTIYEINDGYSGFGPVEKRILAEEPWGIQKISHVAEYYRSLGLYYINQYKQFLRHKTDVAGNLGLENEGYDLGLENQGYVPSNGHLEGPLPPDGTSETGWYNAFHIGIKAALFKQAIEHLAAAGDTVVLYKGPIAPAWAAQMKGSKIEDHEQAFSDLVRSEDEKYPNVYFLDLFADPTIGLTDEDFTDIAHLNDKGAHVFSEFLVNKLGELHILP